VEFPGVFEVPEWGDHKDCIPAGKLDLLQQTPAIMQFSMPDSTRRPMHEKPANWDDLRVFLAVARQNSLDAAAKQLQLDATTIGRRLRRLEEATGATLFERSRRGHALTHSGAELFARMEETEHHIMRSLESVSGEVNAAKGTVRLSVTEAFGNVVIAPALARLFATHPGLTVELVATSGFLSVTKREADMAVMLSRPETGRLRVSKLTDYSLRLYASTAYLSRHPPIRRVDELHDHTLIGYVDDLIYSPRLRYYEEIGSGLQPELTSSSLLAQAQLARTGCGIAMLPLFLGDPDPELAPVLPETVTVTRSFWLAIHEDIHEHARIRVVAEFLRGLAADVA